MHRVSQVSARSANKLKTQLADLNLASLNSMPAPEAEAEFLKCCGSKNWARQMDESRPFGNPDELINQAKSVWWALNSQDWLEAFLSHPKIGETKAAAPTTARAQQWSEDEQSGVRDAAEETRTALAELNKTYEEKFGYIFIVCASGKSSEEMLGILHERLQNNADDELRIAAGEQAKITELRLRKLIDN